MFHESLKLPRASTREPSVGQDTGDPHAPRRPRARRPPDSADRPAQLRRRRPGLVRSRGAARRARSLDRERAARLRARPRRGAERGARGAAARPITCSTSAASTCGRCASRWRPRSAPASTRRRASSRSRSSWSTPRPSCTTTSSTSPTPGAARRRRARSTATPPRSSPATGCWSRRCAGCAPPAHGDLLDEMLAIIEEMILAESLQLERRGQVHGDVADYFRVAEGKTAALFRWAMRAGARAGGLSARACPRPRALRPRARRRLPDRRRLPRLRRRRRGDRQGAVRRPARGQADLPGAARRSSATPPSRRWSPRPIAGADAPVAEQVSRHRAIAERIHGCGALADARRAATDRIAKAVASLASIPEGPGKAALTTVAEATATREK